MRKKNNIIFIVDDDPVMQRITERLLTRNGYKTVACRYGEECVNRAKIEHPDAILMDVMLPDGDGKDFVKTLGEHERTKDIPIIFLTNMVILDDDKEYEIFKINGEVYYAFTKPPNIKRIVPIIQKEITRKQYGGESPKEVRQHQSSESDNLNHNKLDKESK